MLTASFRVPLSLGLLECVRRTAHRLQNTHFFKGSDPRAEPEPLAPAEKWALLGPWPSPPLAQLTRGLQLTRTPSVKIAPEFHAK